MSERMLMERSDYVMSLAINPKDTNTFASACLDRTGMRLRVPNLRLD